MNWRQSFEIEPLETWHLFMDTENRNVQEQYLLNLQRNQKVQLRREKETIEATIEKGPYAPLVRVRSEDGNKVWSILYFLNRGYLIYV